MSVDELAILKNSRRRDANCAHCAQPIPEGRRDEYCCRGCKAVASLIRAASLDRYYDLRRGPGVPIGELPSGPRDRKWLAPIKEKLEASEGGERVALDLQGVHCSACVWLIETVFSRYEGGHLEINPTLGRAELFIPSDFEIDRFVDEVEAFGYRVSAASDKAESPESDKLLLRAGICLALAGNGMMASVAIYVGLDEGIVYQWAREIAFVCAMLAVIIGAPVFVRSAWQGIRRGILHLDLPIALGMGLAFVGSAWSYFVEGGANYVDTLTVFVALMLLGRWLQTRVLERNKRQLLADQGLDGLLTRRIEGDRAELVPATSVEPGDPLLISPGDLVPVESTLIGSSASFSFDWIDGESRPRTIEAGGKVPSGALLVSNEAVRIEATESIESSMVFSLLSGKREREENERALAGLPQNIGGYYVIFVLFASVASALIVHLIHGDLILTLESATAALVVTCPCAFGIAVPLAYEVVQTQLRLAGVFVRRPSLFDRLGNVEKIVFDKTGTLTTGLLELADPATLDSLSESERSILYNLAARSNHPKSRAIATALEDRGESGLDTSLRAREIQGKGLELEIDGAVYRLGEASFALGESRGARELADDGNDLVFSRDQSLVGAFATAESIRPEAREELKRLERDGKELFILSGDHRARCLDIAEELGIDASRVFGDHKPEDKARFIEAHDPEITMMIGDGLNDARALQTALCSGTPSIDRPFTASRCDFYFISPGLEPIGRLFSRAKRLAKTVRTDLAIAIVYNAFAVSLCAAGLMRPWLAAILMPSSSIGTIAYTLISLRERRSPWRS